MAQARVFLDSSVLFAAVYSSEGYARDLIRLAVRGEIRVIVSQMVLDEVQRNITRKAPAKAEDYQVLLQLLNLEIVDDPSPEKVEAVEAYVVQKDAPIIAAAIKARPDYFVTYDRKHLIDPDQVSEQSGLTIVIPEEAVKALG